LNVVDNARIDQRALSKDKKSSESLLLVDKPDGSSAMRDPNVKRAFFYPKGDCWEITSGGNIFHISSEKKELSSMIGVDKTQAIATAERDLQRRGEELKIAKAEDAKLEQEHSKRQREWNRSKRTMQQNDDRINDLASKIDSVNAEIQASVSVTFDPSEYEDDVAQAETKVEQIKVTIARLQDEIEDRKPEIEEFKGRIKEVEARNAKVKDDVLAIQVGSRSKGYIPLNVGSHFMYLIARADEALGNPDSNAG
jgi:hypothetical protein